MISDSLCKDEGSPTEIPGRPVFEEALLGPCNIGADRNFAMM
jgi:hypothetical protein